MVAMVEHRLFRWNRRGQGIEGVSVDWNLLLAECLLMAVLRPWCCKFECLLWKSFQGMEEKFWLFGFSIKLAKTDPQYLITSGCFRPNWDTRAPAELFTRRGLAIRLHALLLGIEHCFHNLIVIFGTTNINLPLAKFMKTCALIKVYRLVVVFIYR